MEQNEMNQTLVTIGNKIYNARKAKGMSRAELGRLVDLHESTVKRYEDGKIQSPNFKKIEAFADVLGLDMLDLIDTWMPAKVDDTEYTIFRPVNVENFHQWQELMDMYWAITDEGQTKVLDYIRDLASHPDYKRLDKLPGKLYYNEIE